jgi:glucan 1,3-beta-glucosidase
MYFVRFVGWARQYGIEVWLDVHTATGSQNGFDNSGQLLPDAPTCKHWITSPVNVNRSLMAIQDIAQAVMDDNLRDVVTGFGILNEPYEDCGVAEIKRFNNDALKTIRGVMGEDTAVYMADSFNATKWNNGWWTDEDQFSNTFLDSHYYHVFAQRERALSPRQHIAYTCAKLAKETASCCYHDPPHDTQPSRGISRIVGEWSASFDTLVVEKLRDVMVNIHDNHEALEMDRKLTKERVDFLRNHVEAQMVAFESVQTGVSNGWFYWTLKTEGGAFAEWDFLRGLREEWIPKFPARQTSSESVFGTCQQIAQRTEDDTSIVHPFPNPDERDTWIGPPIDDDYVISHAGSATATDHDGGSAPENKGGGSGTAAPSSEGDTGKTQTKSNSWRWFRFLVFLLLAYGVWHVFLKDEYGFGRQRNQYTSLHATSLNI